MTESGLTRNQLVKFAELLAHRKEEISHQLAQAESAVAPVTLDQQSVGRVSRIDAIQQQQMAIANKTQTNQLLQRIASALERLEDGNYGYCLRCGERIAMKRLEVQPEVTLCIDCQSDSEK